jgi:hypothetical protein
MHKTTTTAPGFSGAQHYPFLIDPLSYVLTRPRPPPVNQGMTSARRPQGIARSSQDLGSFTVPSPTSPQHPRDGWPLPGHVVTTTSTVLAEPSPLRHHLRVLGIPRPPIDPIKGKAEGSLGDKNKEHKQYRDILLFWDKHLKQLSIFLFS